MELNETFKTWASMPIKKMVVTVLLVVVVGAGYMFDTYGDRIKWTAPIDVTPVYLKQEISGSPFDYIGVFEYDFTIPGAVSEKAKACQNSNYDICYRSKEYFVYQDLYRFKMHMQNLCEVKRYKEGDTRFAMKVIGSCPIVYNNELRGYVMVTSILNADSTTVIEFLRKTAIDISNKM